MLREGVIAAVLTALMILLFLGSWRSTLVVATSIPLSIFCSIIILGALGQTLNIMTLGGLALAVGILVDDATVEIENIHRNLAMKKPMVRAILDGASRSRSRPSSPRSASASSSCRFFSSAERPSTCSSRSPWRSSSPCWRPISLSRTVVPTMVKYLLSDHLEELDLEEEHAAGDEAPTRQSDANAARKDVNPSRKDDIPSRKNVNPSRKDIVPSRKDVALSQADVAPERKDGPPAREKPHPKRSGGIIAWLQRIHHGFNHYFDRLRDRYVGALTWSLEHRMVVVLVMVGMTLISLGLVPFLGRDFFPTVDSGQFRLHVRAPAGTRLEATAARFYQVGQVIREVIPAAEIKTVLDNIGLPVSGINLAFSDNATISAADGEILVALNDNHHPTADYVRTLRTRLRHDFPDMDFYFSAPDIVSQILNFGIPAPIDIQISGKDTGNYALAQKIQTQVAQIPGAVDVHLHQQIHGPDLEVKVDRTRAEQIGLTQSDVAKTMLISLSSSGQSAPNFWLNFENGVNYQVAVQTPQYKMDTLQDLKNTPVVAPGLPRPELLGNLSEIVRKESPVIVNHYNVQPVFDVLANVQGRDLGGVAGQIGKFVEEAQKKLPRGTFINIRGQVESMNKSFTGLGFGILFAIVLVYFLMVVNFQSWTDPFIIIMALPGALCGIIWMLFITGTTLNVPSLMGAIMAIGVATANSILVVTFANDERCGEQSKSAHDAALSAGYTRLRPVIMTALAMIIGMLPMALGLGEGGEQNAPLGRAVIGGLLVATFATLFFVPVVYSYLRKGEFICDEDGELEEEAGQAQPQAANP